MSPNPMTPDAQQYLERVHRGLMCLEREKRAEIMAELTDSMLERMAGTEGQDARQKAETVALAEPPQKVIQRYRDLYGYSRGWTIGAVLITTLFALASRPALVLDERAGLFVVATLAYLLATLYYSLNGGWQTGLACGVAAGLVRLVTLSNMLRMGTAEELDTGLFVVSYVLVTLAGLALGYLPGKLKQNYLEKYGWTD